MFQYFAFFRRACVHVLCLRVQLHPERDLGVPIDVIDPRNYLLPKNPPPLAKEDEALLNWRDGDVASSGARKKMAHCRSRKGILNHCRFHILNIKNSSAVGSKGFIETHLCKVRVMLS